MGCTLAEKKLTVIPIRKEKSLSEPLPVQDSEAMREKIRLVLNDILNCMLKNTEAVSVSITQGERTTVYVIDVEKGDFGRLVGAKGKNIESLRTIIQGMAGAHGFRAIIQIKDEDRFF